MDLWSSFEKKQHQYTPPKSKNWSPPSAKRLLYGCSVQLLERFLDVLNICLAEYTFPHLLRDNYRTCLISSSIRQLRFLTLHNFSKSAVQRQGNFLFRERGLMYPKWSFLQTFYFNTVKFRGSLLSFLCPKRFSFDMLSASNFISAIPMLSSTNVNSSLAKYPLTNDYKSARSESVGTISISWLIGWEKVECH